MQVTEDRITATKASSDDELAKVLWDYHHLNMDLRDNGGIIRADCLIVCGSNEERVAERAADLYLSGQIKKIVFSGRKIHERLEEKYGQGLTEAEVFAKIAIERGVPREAILIENEAKNTPENMTKSVALLNEKGVPFQSIIVVSARQHERRSIATAQKKIPEVEIQVTSPNESFEEFINHPQYRKGRIRALVGHTLRLYLFGRKGDLVKQELPDDVIEAYRELIKRYEPLGIDSLRDDMREQGVDLELKVVDEERRESEGIAEIPELGISREVGLKIR